MQWYFYDKYAVKGPIAWAHIVRLPYRSSHLEDPILVCCEDSEQWLSFLEARELNDTKFGNEHTEQLPNSLNYGELESPRWDTAKREKMMIKALHKLNAASEKSFNFLSQEACFAVGFIALLSIFIIVPMCVPKSTSTDGVFESATEKLDRGLPLNEREKQRIDDIINYKRNQEIEEIEKRNY